MIKKLAVVYALAVLLILVPTGIIYIKNHQANPTSIGKLVSSNVYQGEMDTMAASYIVVINEADRGQNYRQVHLNVMGTYPIRISGHDYESDGEWDRIFFCGPHPLVKAVNPKTLGCNSAVRFNTALKLGWKFVPTPLDQGNVVPFSPETIRFAIRELDAAMTLHNKSHLVYEWRWDEKTKQGVEMWPTTY